MQRIVHLGLGNFHRAHQAWYTSKTGDWNITGVIMSNRQLRDDLARHNNQYLLGTWGTNGLTTETISVYDDVLLVTEDAKKIIKKIADRDTHVVTLTVTEKGYYLRSDNGLLDVTAKPIAQDLTSDEPKTAIGLLAAGLISRAHDGAGPLTVLSCDNLSENGRKLRQAIFGYLAVKAPETTKWVTGNVTFPNTMVDRITPKLGDGAISEIRNSAGKTDVPAVGTEAFSEWIIEDNFFAPRPEWEKVGALFVPEVASFEERKLRLLNSSHSFLAYAGLLAGHQYVHEAIADPLLNAGVNALWDEAAVTVSKPASDTLDNYRSALLDRFAVQEMRHDLSQIAMDGSLKLRERLVPILQERSKNNLSSPQTLKAIAAWMAYVCKSVEDGTTISDPNADKLASAVQKNDDVSHICEKLSQFIGLPSDLAPTLAPQVTLLLTKH